MQNWYDVTNVYTRFWVASVKYQLNKNTMDEVKKLLKLCMRQKLFKLAEWNIFCNWVDCFDV